MKNIFGSGDVEVGKFRETNGQEIPSNWKYHAYSPNRYFKGGRRFGERTYKHLNDMAEDITSVFNPEEEVRITPRNSELKVNKRKALQYSHLDDNELLELTREIIIRRSIGKIDTI